MKDKQLTEVWRQYEEGRAYKRQIGLYSRVDENERFYRGDQWKGVNAGALPTPVFNLVKRIASYLVSAVLNYKLSVRYVDTGLPFVEDSRMRRTEEDTLHALNRITGRRWKQSGMDNLLREALFDAVLTGDGIFYCRYDETLPGEGDYPGDIRTAVIDSVNLFAADMNLDDIQSQRYLILAGRCSVERLRKEAAACGFREDDLKKIQPDSDTESQAGDLSDRESGEKTTYLIKFYRNREGYVCWEKAVRQLVLKKVQTRLKRYPVAMFHWDRAKNSFHGSSPVSELISNQKYINKAYALLMKHMTDTAFSKVIYDKRLIPEWSNEVGQAIGVLSGGDVSGAAVTLGVGQMQSEYMQVIESVIENTKDLTGATDIVLGEADPTNTSAIIALREAAEVPLDHVRASLSRCVESLALIWLEMMKAYFPDQRGYALDGEVVYLKLRTVNTDAIGVYVDSGASKRFSQSLLLTTLNSLLSAGHITFAEYLERLPDGILTEKEKLLDRARREDAAQRNARIDDAESMKGEE